MLYFLSRVWVLDGRNKNNLYVVMFLLSLDDVLGTTTDPKLELCLWECGYAVVLGLCLPVTYYFLGLFEGDQ